MGLILSAVVLSIGLVGPMAMAEDCKQTRVMLANKVVGIEVTDKKTPGWAMDDDGVLVLSILLAHCNRLNAQKVSDSEFLTCADQVRPILLQAAKRSAEYLEEQSKIDKSAALKNPAQLMLGELRTEQKRIEELVAIFSKPKVKASEYEKWKSDGIPLGANRKYQLLTAPGEKFDPNKQVELKNLLFALLTMCGEGVPDRLMESLKGISWEKRDAHKIIDGKATSGT